MPLNIYCPNCGTKMMLSITPFRRWVCPVSCENATNPSKEVQEIGTKSGSNQKRRFTVPGSGKMSYTVVQLYHTPDPSREWQCSCPAWTRHVPRTDCKHIIRVKVENMTTKESEAYKQVAAMLKSSGINHQHLANLLKPTVAIDPNTGQNAPIKPKPATGGRKFR